MLVFVPLSDLVGFENHSHCSGWHGVCIAGRICQAEVCLSFALNKLEKIVDDYKERMKQELSELETRLEKLNEFIETGQVFKQLDTEEQHLLVKQQMAMEIYASVLQTRLT